MSTTGTLWAAEVDVPGVPAGPACCDEAQAASKSREVTAPAPR